MDERKMKANADMDSDVTDRLGHLPLILYECFISLRAAKNFEDDFM